MAKNMTFNASLRLNSKNFQKGVAQVQRSLASLKSSFLSVAGALGLGLSFGKLGSSLLDTATKLSAAQNTLKNVSKEFGEYGKNLEWLRKISNEYGQDLIVLTRSFAQFRAAAASSRLSLDQMRDIYEALTRAAGAFHLSSEDTNNVMLAVTQMLSKGKVAAEELRRQLGNSLPGAFNLMALAAYTAGIITENSTAALEDAMKAGKVAAEKVLPEFAKVLKEATANADFDSLQSSMNKLKNSWTTMVEGANFEGFYKGIVDAANKVVEYFTNSFWTKILTVLSGIFGTTAMSKWGKNFVTGIKSAADAGVAEFNNAYKKILALEDKIIDKTILLGIDNKEDYRNATAPKMLKSKQFGGPLMAPNEKYLSSVFGASPEDILDLRKAAAEYNDELLKLNQLQKTLTGRALFSKAQQREIEETNVSIREFISNAEKGDDVFSKVNKEVNTLSVGLSKTSVAAKKLWGALKSAFTSLAIGAVVAGITYLISKFIEARKEAQRIKNIVTDMEEAVKQASGANNQTLVGLTRVRKELERIDKTGDVKQKKILIDQVNKSLGRTGDQMLTISDDIQTKVIKAMDDYIDSIKEAARQQAILAQISSATSRVIQLESENSTMMNDDNWGQKVDVNGGVNRLGIDPTMKVGETLTAGAVKLQSKVEKNTKEINQLNEGIDRLLKLASDETKNAIYGGKTSVEPEAESNPDGGGGSTSSKATPQSVLEDYKKELKKLENQYQAGAIKAADYEKEVEKLNQKAFEELASFGWDTALKGLVKSGDKELANQIKSIASENLFKDDPKEIEEFDKAMQEEADRAYELYKEAWQKFLDFKKKNPVIAFEDNSDAYMYSNKKKRGQSYSDYDTHLIEGDLDAYKNYISKLKDYRDDLQAAIGEMTDPTVVARLNKLLDETITKLVLAERVVKDLKDKANVAKLEKEIMDLKKQGLDSIFNSITALADGTDRLYRAIQSVKQINDETWQNEELEDFLTKLNALIQTFEVFKTIIEAVTAATEVYSKIKEKQSMKAIALNAAEAASETAKGSAAAKAAAAGGASAVASIPYVGPVLAVAAVASITAAILAGMKKFSHGGFVGGSRFGDQNIVRANGGEFIMTTAQQKRLLDIVDGKKSVNNSKGGEVQFKIKGDTLVGVLNNYNRIKRG